MLAALDAPDRVALHPEWVPLPSLGEKYFVVLAEWAELPLLDDRYQVAADQPLGLGQWRLVEIAADDPPPPSRNYAVLEHLAAAEVFFRGVAFDPAQASGGPVRGWSGRAAAWPVSSAVRGRAV